MSFSPYPPAPVFTVKPPKDPRLTGAVKILNQMCLLVLMQTAASFVWTLLFELIALICHMDVLSDPVAYQLLTGALVPLSTALPFFFYLVAKGGPAEYLRFEKVGFTTALLCVLAGIALCMLSNYPAFAVQEFFGNFGYEPTPDVTAGQESWLLLALEIFSTAIVVPVMEEFAFRGVLLSSLRRYGSGFAIVASALVFSLVHLDFANVVFALLCGLVFGFLYVRTGNLWITISIHALNNLLAVLGSYGEFLFGDGAGLFETLTMVVPVFLGALAMLLLLLRRRHMFRLPGVWDGRSLTAGESAACIVKAPLLWVIVGFMVLYTVTLFL